MYNYENEVIETHLQLLDEKQEEFSKEEFIEEIE